MRTEVSERPDGDFNVMIDSHVVGTGKLVDNKLVFTPLAARSEAEDTHRERSGGTPNHKPQGNPNE